MSLTELRPVTIEQVWTVEDIPVLTARITLPEPANADVPASRRIRRYYQLQQRACLRRCEKLLLPRAETEYRTALAISAPLPCFRMEADFSVTFRDDRFLSLYTQMRETGLPGRDRLQRWGDTWNTAGYPVALPEFFPPRSNWKKELLRQMESEILRQEAADAAHYHPHVHRALRRHFNPRSYYLTPEGLTIFYPVSSLAPPKSGILTFTLPFCEGGPDPAWTEKDRRETRRS